MRMKFSALNADFSSPSPDLLCSRKPAHAGVKKGTQPKSGYFSDIGLSSVKTVADRHMHAAYHTSIDDVLFSSINTDDFE